MENALLYLPKAQVEKNFEIEKRMTSEDLVYGKHKFNRYGKVISFVFNFLTEVTDTDEMYNLLNNRWFITINQYYLMAICWRINKELQQNEYLQRNYLNEDRHHHHYQYHFLHKELLVKVYWNLEKKTQTKFKTLTPNKLLTRFISANKWQKQFMYIKKWNQPNTISLVSISPIKPLKKFAAI